MQKAKIGLAVLAVLAVFMAGYAVAVLTTSKELSNLVTVSNTVNLGIFDSSSNTTELTFLDWGTFSPTQLKTIIIWIQNEGGIWMDINLTTKNWNPVNAEQNFNFTYGKSPIDSSWGGTTYPTLAPYMRASMILYLRAGDTVANGSVTFTIVITGTAG